MVAPAPTHLPSHPPSLWPWYLPTPFVSLLHQFLSIGPASKTLDPWQGRAQLEPPLHRLWRKGGLSALQASLLRRKLSLPHHSLAWVRWRPLSFPLFLPSIHPSTHPSTLQSLYQHTLYLPCAQTYTNIIHPSISSSSHQSSHPTVHWFIHPNISKSLMSSESVSYSVVSDSL